MPASKTATPRAVTPLMGREMLQEMVQKFGTADLSETKKSVRHASTGQRAVLDGKRQELQVAVPGKKRRPGSATKTVADLLRGWATYKPEDVQPDSADYSAGWATLADGLPSAGGSSNSPLNVHRKLLAGLGSLQRLKTELELTFQAVASLGAPSWGPDSLDAEFEGEHAAQGSLPDEIAVQFELQGSIRTSKGKAQAVLLRTPWAFEMVHGSETSSATSRYPTTTPSTRPGTPRAETGTPLALLDASSPSRMGGTVATLLFPEEPAGADDGKSYSGWYAGQRPLTPQVVGDHGHALSLSLRERVPESVILRRVGSGRTKSGVARRDRPEALPPLRSLPDAAWAASEEEARTPTAWLNLVEAQCARLEKNFGPKLTEHSEELGADAREENGQDTNAPEGPGRLEEYLRDMRSVIRLLGPGLPTAARLLEGIVKGTVVSLDTELQLFKERLASAEAELTTAQETKTETAHLRRELATLQERYESVKKQLASADKIKQDEAKNYIEKINKLKEEIQRLNPEEGSVEGVAGLMDTCSMLLEELEEESFRQSKILSEMTKYTASIVRETANEDPMKIKSHKPGRVVELNSGELMLRPHTVAEQGVQVIESDLLKVSLDAPIQYRSPPIRRLIASFQGRKMRKINLEELTTEIDKLYSAKVSSDAEADAANFPRSELADFVVAYYLDQTGTVTEAQEKLCSILDCIQRLMQGGGQVPLKVSLFARFLEFCEFDKALPLSVLNTALQAKRLAAASTGRGNGGKEQTLGLKLPQSLLNARGSSNKQGSRIGIEQTIKNDGPLAEHPIPVPIAWDCGSKALPNGGTAAARRELFVALMKHTTLMSMEEDKRPGMKEFYFLLMIVHDRIKKEAAAKMRDLIGRVEARGQATADEFRDALRDAQILGVDEQIWRPKLTNAAAGGNQGLLTENSVIDYLGGGSQGRLPKGYVTESQLLAATSEAATADVRERTESLKKIYRQAKGSQADLKTGKLSFNDLKLVLESADSSMPAATIKALFIESVEASRSCFQSDSCSVVGSLDASPNGLYGGEIVTLPLVHLASLRSNLLALKEQNTTDFGRDMKDKDAGGVPKSAVSMRSNVQGKSPSAKKINKPR